MKRLVIAALALIVVAAGAILAIRMLAPAPADLDLSLSKATERGLYVAAIAPEAGEAVQGPLHSWIVTLTAPDGTPVEDATFTIGGGMPQHGHGLPTSPAVTAHIGEGRYRIEGVRFNMGGWWELDLAISATAGEDNVTFNILL